MCAGREFTMVIVQLQNRYCMWDVGIKDFWCINTMIHLLIYQSNLIHFWYYNVLVYLAHFLDLDVDSIIKDYVYNPRHQRPYPFYNDSSKVWRTLSDIVKKTIVMCITFICIKFKRLRNFMSQIDKTFYLYIFPLWQVNYFKEFFLHIRHNCLLLLEVNKFFGY